MKQLRNYVLNILLKGSETVDLEKHDYVMSILARETYPTEDTEAKTPLCDEICSLIFKTLIYKMKNARKSPTDATIMSIATPDFCVECAYEYLKQLEINGELKLEDSSMKR